MVYSSVKVGYESLNFNRTDVKCGSFGGKTAEN